MALSVPVEAIRGRARLAHSGSRALMRPRTASPARCTSSAWIRFGGSGLSDVAVLATTISLRWCRTRQTGAAERASRAGLGCLRTDTGGRISAPAGLPRQNDGVGTPVDHRKNLAHYPSSAAVTEAV